MIKKIINWLTDNKPRLYRLTKDIRDLDFRDLFGDVPDYTPMYGAKVLSPIYNQDQKKYLDCSFNAWADALGVYFGEEVSVRWLVAKAWQNKLCDKYGSAELRNGGKVAQKYGVVFEKNCPTDSSLPWEEFIKVDFEKLDKIAAEHKIPSYTLIRKVNDYLKAIDLGYPVVIGRKWYSSMNSWSLKSPWIISRKGIIVGAHATGGVGYDLQYLNERVAIESNSYGTSYGDNGIFYSRLNELESDMYEYGGFTITPVPYTPKEERLRLLNQILILSRQLLEMLKKKA